jgi:hypothetical protein
MARTVRDQGIVVMQVYNIDLTAASVDVALDMMCPGDNAFVLDWTIQSSTVGIGDGTHTLRLEHGTTTDGVELSAEIAVLAVTDMTAGAIHSADGLGRPSTGGTTQGTKIQIRNVESGTAITTGAIVDVMVRWQL